MAYATLDEFKDWIRLSGSDVDDDGHATAVLTAAQRSIDHLCGRSFDTADSATARLYAPASCDTAPVDDLWTTDSLLIEVRYSTAGSWVTWDTDDYQLEPLNGIVDGVTGWPYNRIRALRKAFPEDGFAGLRVTAKWGWAAVPAEVVTATMVQASRWLKRREAPLGLLEFTADGSALRVSPVDGDVLRMLAPFRAARSIGIA